MDYSLGAIYGGGPAPQPTSTPGPADVPAGAASPARTVGRVGVLDNPTFLLVAFIAVFLGLVHFSVGFGR